MKHKSWKYMFGLGFFFIVEAFLNSETLYENDKCGKNI